MDMEKMMAEFQKLKAEKDALEAENSKLKAQKTKEVYFKVSEKGAVSMYGLSRFPVTLYMEQWGKVFEHKEAIEAFIEENKDTLVKKEDKKKDDKKMTLAEKRESKHSA
jgi:hypothetical protein